MPSPEPPVAEPRPMTSTSRLRWDELLCGIAGLLPAAGPVAVLVDGEAAAAGLLAARLAATLHAIGRPCTRLPAALDGEGGFPAAIRLADGPEWRGTQPWDVVIWVRTTAGGGDGFRREG